jgi:hypothetical protein
MLSSQEEQIERRRVFAQDQSLPNPGSTFHQHALAEAQTPRGRFSAVEASYVVGSKAGMASAYPAAAAHQRDPVPIEPPLGYSVNDLNPSDLEPSMAFVEAQPGGPADAPSTPLDVERAGPSLSQSGDLTADGEQSRSQSDGYVVSPVPYCR